MPILLNWGQRSEQLRALHAKIATSRSFLLAKAPTPAALGALTPSQLASWDSATVTPLAVVPVKGTYTAEVTLPPSTSHLRLDFDLKVTIGGVTASCLEFRQLFNVGPGDVLSPAQYSFRDQVFKPVSTAGRAPIAAPGTARRVILGSCPLLRVLSSSVIINCEFLDVTELWWAHWASADQWGWMLDPDLRGHPELLRVLAWTSGCAPMLWFVALSSHALEGSTATARTGADVLLMRAQAGFNTFRYKSDESGFLDPSHGDTTCFHLGRWLLSTLPESEIGAKITKTGSATLPFGVGHAGVRLRPLKMPPPKISPGDPLDMMASDVRWAFRPAGVHNALLRSLHPDIAFLPLGFDGGGEKDPYTSGGGYTALLKTAALRQVIDSARALLWIRGALNRTQTATPTFDRQIWLAANSAANALMFACLKVNASEIDRIVSMDATPADKVLLPIGVPAVQTAMDTRTKAGRKFKAIFVTTPNMWSGKPAYLEIEKKLRATNADIEMLPPNAEFDAYWQHPPTALSNPLMFEALNFWEGNGLASSNRLGTVPKGNQWLWWHEWSVHGGHFETASSPQATAAGPPPPSRVRPFFEDAIKL